MRRIDRRTLLLGAAAVVAGGACGRGAAADQPVTTLPPPPTLDVYRGGAPPYVEQARAWIAPLPDEVLVRAAAVLPDDMQQSLRTGFIALSAVCPRDQIELRFCQSAGWFECPACGSRFDGLGDKMGGPAPRGMTMLRVSLDDAGSLFVHPRPRVPGLEPRDFLVRHYATGPHCA